MEQPKDPQKELEIALHELEERVDRLRALYEQYFMGYEKIEPGVQRKDVDRRFAMLRKIQIRNTALRFRFNVVTQKFNTYAMYWTRVCRQIEEGTFKRHIVRATRRFGGPAKAGRSEEASIDVDLGDFETEAVDMDSFLAELDAEASAFDRGGSTDTIPPGGALPSDPPTAIRPAQVAAQPLVTPRTPVDPMPRVGRPAALPAGTKPRVVVRKTHTAPLEFQPTGGNASPPSTSGIRATHPPEPPSSVRSPVTPLPPPPASASPPAARSAGAIPVATPARAAPPPSIRRIPVVGPASEPGLPIRRPAPPLPSQLKKS